MQREQEQLKNASLKQMVKNHEQDLEDKKKYMQIERKQKARDDIINKIMQENERRVDIEG